VSNFRKGVSFIENDRILHNDMAEAERFLKAFPLD
jgi:histidine ammonia-lyase